MGDHASAIQYHEKALAVFQKIKDKKGIASSYTSLGELYLIQRNLPLALETTQRALTIADGSGLLKSASDIYRNLSRIYESQSRFDSAFLAYKSYILLRDSINNVEKKTELTRKTLQFEFSKKEDSLRQYQALTDAKLPSGKKNSNYNKSPLIWLPKKKKYNTWLI
jgi:tetratricopeptide (TPR) repeat protein